MNRPAQSLIALCAMLGLAACGKASQLDATDANSSVKAAQPSAAANDDLGPAMLSTVGGGANPPLTNAKAKQGTFALLEMGNAPKQLTVNGTPWTYTSLTGPTLVIEANNDLSLMGIIELPHESVAWAVITGGQACPATHILVSIKDGKPMAGQAIPGCDDRGTIRRVGDHLAFEVGGSTGTYRDGLLTLETRGDQGGQ